MLNVWRLLIYVIKYWLRDNNFIASQYVFVERCSQGDYQTDFN